MLYLLVAGQVHVGGKPPVSLVKTLLSGFHEMRWVPYYIYWHDCRYEGANVSSQQYCL